MIDENKIEELCLKGESVTLDYKSEQYKFGDGKTEKSELLKDILSFANAWRQDNAYILIGVSEKDGKGEICSIQSGDVIDDANIQQFINSKTNKNIPFSCYSMNCKNEIVQIIEIKECENERPFYATKDYGIVKKNSVIIRRGTSTSEASPDEIVKMTEARIAKRQPSLEAYISPAGINNYSTEGITLCTVDVVLEDVPVEHKPNDPVRNLINIYSKISAKDKQRWIKECFRICGINLKLKNVSDIQAKDLRIETKISNAEVKITEIDRYPSKPQNGPMIPDIPFNNFMAKGISIHPKDTHTEEKLIYLQPEGSGAADLIVTVYGENLRSPLIFKFKLQFLVEKRTLTPECLKEEYWSSLEEDFIFNLLNGEKS